MPRDWVNEAQRRLGEGEASLTDVLPGIIAKILRDGLWKHRTTKDGRAFASFREFCEYKLWWGLECPYDRMRAYCEHNEEARRLLAEELEPVAAHGEIGNGRGRVDNSNSTTESKGGTSQTYTLRRLKRDRPDLAERVVSGDLSAHAAAIEAGFRRPAITLTAADPENAAQKIRATFGDDFALALGTALVS